MIYFMSFRVDGGCRNNGYPNAYASACAVLEGRQGRAWYMTMDLDNWDHTPTNQRAELTAIILALDWALEKCERLQRQYNNPQVDVMIHSDSRYAVGCMTRWIDNWRRNGWFNSSGRPVANRDLIRKALRLENAIGEWGPVDYVWVPRSETMNADRYCNEALDAQEY